MNHGLEGDRVSEPPVRILSVGSLPPSWGGPAYGGVATLHATLLEGFVDPSCPIEVVGVAPPAPLARDLSLPVFAREPDEPAGEFYEELLERLAPDVVVMHHFAHRIGLTHARLKGAPPAVGVAHSWHNITFRSGEERARALETTSEALGGLAALVGMSRHCLREGKELGLSYPSIVETIYHPLQSLYSGDGLDVDGERAGVAYLGSLMPRKDPGGVVEAAARLPGTEVTLAGHGELEDQLQSLIASLSLSDRVAIRHLDDHQVRTLLLRSEAMCLPSRSETFGLAYTEALACGTPVIGFAATLAEIREQVGIEVGELLEGSGPEEIAEALERVRLAEWDRAELRRRTLAAFGLPKATERYVELIEHVGRGSTAEPPRRVGPGHASGERNASTAICVLGMSRTGTSLTARILNLAGVYLGPEEELLGGELTHLAAEGETVRARAREANPEGFWEHYRLMRLNERLLKALGGNWREPPCLTSGWEASEQLADEREEAEILISESFSGHALWGWKDPRNSLTLPFWQRLVPDMRYVICLRNPVDVAASLERRDGMALERGAELWMTYLAAALVNTSGRPRLLVPYESYFDDPRGTVARLTRFATRKGALDRPGAEALLAEAIDPRLWRNRTPASEIARAGWLPAGAVALHLAAEQLALATDGTEQVDDEVRRLSDAVDLQANRILGQLDEAASQGI